MDNNQWQAALADMQPSYGKVQPPAQPGKTGNMPYSPGMMAQFQGPNVPRARDLMASEGPVDVQPGPSGGLPSQAQAPNQSNNPVFSPQQTQGLLAALQNILSGRMGVAATRGIGTRY